jgi:hypothetical protein
MRTYALSLLAAAAVAVCAVGAATATSPADGSGTIVIGTDVTTNVRHADGNTFLTQTETGVLTGTLSGPYTLERTITLFSNGSVSIHADATCTCTVDGKTGTTTAVVNGRGKAGEPAVDHLTITGATDGLAGFHAQGTIVAEPGGGPITYTLRYHFDP